LLTHCFWSSRIINVMKSRYTLFYGKLEKTLFDKDGKEIFKSPRLRVCLSMVPVKAQLSVVISAGLRTRELIIPDINERDLEEIVRWKLLKNFPELKSYVFAFYKNTGQYACKLKMIFVKELFIELVTKRCQARNILLHDICVEAEGRAVPLTRRREPLSKVRLLAIAGLLVVMGVTYFNINRFLSMQVRDRVLESREKPKAFPAAVINNSFQSSYGRLEDFVRKQVPAGMKLLEIRYDRSAEKIYFKGWQEQKPADMPGAAVTAIQEKGSYYVVEGEADANR
jgi:hypothetical protein